MAIRTWILAIDFGTSYTVAAALVSGRSAEVIEVDGNRRVPSVVLAEGDTYVVGKLADELSAAYPGRTLRAPKRRIGDASPVVLDGRPHQAVDLIAAVLKHVYDEAVRQYGHPPTEVRLTHPAVWARPQLNRLLEAATKAGIEHAVLVSEPVAAALAYATEVGVAPQSHVAVYDLGGGTFDTAVVTPTDYGFQIVGRPGGDRSIGGELFDELLAEHIGSQLNPATWESIQSSDDQMWRRLSANLRHEIRRGKEMLSGYPVAELLVQVPGELIQKRVTREEFEALIEPHVASTIELLERCIRDAGIDPTRLAAVYLVGGASRTPLIARMIEERFPGIPISRRGDPKTSTAIGAALAVRSEELSSSDAAQRAGQGHPTPPPTPFGAIPISKPPSVPPAPPTGPPEAATFVNPNPQPRRRRRKGLWIGLVLLVTAAGVGTGLVLATSKDDGATSEVGGPATTPADLDGATSEVGGPATTSAAITNPASTVTSPGKGPRCVRPDIDFAGLRDAPSKDATLLDQIPAGSCDATVAGREEGATGEFWLKLRWNGQDGYSIESNFLIPGSVATAMRDVLIDYYARTIDGDFPTAWSYLTPDVQTGLTSFENFVQIFSRFEAIEVSRFKGCSAATAPADCYFVTQFTNKKGGISEWDFRFGFVQEGDSVLISSSQQEFIKCIRINPGESDCATD